MGFPYSVPLPHRTDGNRQEWLTRKDIWEGRLGINNPGSLLSKGESGGEAGRRQGWAGQGTGKGQWAREYHHGGKAHKPLSVDLRRKVCLDVSYQGHLRAHLARVPCCPHTESGRGASMAPVGSDW